MFGVSPRRSMGGSDAELLDDEKCKACVLSPA